MILTKTKKIDPITNKENNAFWLKEEDYLLGLSFFKNVHEKNIIEILTNIKMDLLKKLFKNKMLDNKNKEKILKIKASIGHLKINNNNNLINAVTFPTLLNLVCSLSEILKVKFNKLQCKRWSNSISEELVDDYDIFIIKKIESIPDDKNSNIDNIFKTLKGLRDLFTHYHEYRKTKEDSNKYVLLRTIYLRNSVYIIVVKNFSDIQIYEYKEENILETIKVSLNQKFTQGVI